MSGRMSGPMSGRRPHVVIAGAGLAGCALAMLLRRRGIAVTLLAAPASPAAGRAVEALPEAAVRLLQEIGLATALRRAGGVAVRGFENCWEPGAPRRLEGWWVHVERTALTREARAEAQRQGARFRATGVDLDLETAAPAIDATGRGARHTRPLARSGAAVAALFDGPGSRRAEPGRVARIAGGWVYRLAHPERTTVGVVAAPGSAAPRTLPEEAAAALALPAPEAFVSTGRRPAFAQWAVEPIRGRALAIGDAALAYDPLAGQGLRFALASALAAAPLIAAWSEGDDGLAAADYYRTFLLAARQRHLHKLEELYGAAAGRADEALAPTETGEAWWRFAAATRRTGLQRAGRIEMDEALVCADGGLVRWLGGFDLLRLRALASSPCRLSDLGDRLEREGLGRDGSPALLAWCVRHGLLAACPPQP